MSADRIIKKTRPDFPGWTLASNGLIPLKALTGWGFLVADGGGLLRLELIPDPEALETGEREYVQISLTRAQAAELSDDFYRLAGVLQQFGPAEDAVRN